MLVYFLHCF